jgi:hypothetical protein
MRRVLLSACAGLALLAGVGFAGAASAQEQVVPRTEVFSVFGQPTDVTVVRATLLDIYGAWPQGFEPRAVRPVPAGWSTLLPVTQRGQGYYNARLYWKFNSSTSMFEPKVRIAFYRSLSPEDVIARGDFQLGLASPNGDPFVDPDGNPIVNPVTLTPVESVSPTTTGFGV